jgi:hypothetical protein
MKMQEKDKSNPVVQIEKKRSSVAEVTTDAKRRSSSSDTSSTAKAAPDLQKMAKITENDENARNTVATTTLDKLDEIVTTPLHQVQKMGDTPRDGDTQAVDYMNLLDEMLQTGVHTLPIQQKEDPKGRSLESDLDLLMDSIVSELKVAESLPKKTEETKEKSNDHYLKVLDEIIKNTAEDESKKTERERQNEGGEGKNK